MAGFDYLDVSLRSFQSIDFRLTDAYGTTINFKKLSLEPFGDISEKVLNIYSLIRNVPQQLHVSDDGD